jgi:hypothetical protein
VIKSKINKERQTDGHRIMIDWCLTPTLAVLRLYSGENKLYILNYITPKNNKETVTYNNQRNQAWK